MKIIVNIFLKNGILDPKAKAIQDALYSLNFNEIRQLRVAKQIILDLDELEENRARLRVKKMCEELLVNSVIEDYELIVGEK